MPHTPGPWRVATVGESQIHNTPVNGETPNLIATTEYYPSIEGLGQGHETQKANARLIAAAPELLAELRSIVLHCGAGGAIRDQNGRLAKARAAIAKATGEVTA